MILIYVLISQWKTNRYNSGNREISEGGGGELQWSESDMKEIPDGSIKISKIYFKYMPKKENIAIKIEY